MLQEANGLAPGDASKDQRAQHGDRIRRGAVKMPRDFARRVKSGDWPFVAKNLCLLIGGKSAERIGQTAHQGISEIRRLRDRPRPVRFRRRQSLRSRARRSA